MGTDTEYEVLVGMNFMPDGARKERRLEPGDTIKRSEFPKRAKVDPLVEQGVLTVKGGDS